MHESQKLRRDQTPMYLGRIIKRLRMVAVDFGHAPRLDVAFEEFATATDRETEVLQSALIAPPRSVTDDDRQNVDTQMIVIGTPDGTTEQEPAVAATEIDNHR